MTPFLGLNSGEEVDPAFVANVSALGIIIEPDSLTPVGAKTYEVTARDKGGNSWVLGLTARSGQLILIYAEPQS